MNEPRRKYAVIGAGGMIGSLAAGIAASVGLHPATVEAEIHHTVAIIKSAPPTKIDLNDLRHQLAPPTYNRRQRRAAMRGKKRY